jgi:hypothetical protein
MDKELLELLNKVKAGWLSPEYVLEIIKKKQEIALLKQKLQLS